jgi:CubicO group peptidase (beta-lactamase class C family)
MNQPQFAKARYAPTEFDRIRGGIMQGEVHDENAWSLRGVAPHAGLFGTIDDLSEFGLAVRKALAGKRSFVSEKTAHRFSRRSVPRSRGDWALGWMMPSRPQSSCGQYFSSRSIGHTGFTGTSLWYDPKRDLLVTILSNRVYPTRENREFVSLRPMLHNFVVESIQ